MLKSILVAKNQFLIILYNKTSQTLAIFVDCIKIPSHGKSVFVHLLLKLHIYRYTTNVHGCKKFYKNFTK